MKVVNFQIDAADPFFIYTHLDSLPFLKRKILNGTSGALITYGGSPMSWTSFWTAQPPDVHGINGFFRRISYRGRIHAALDSFLKEPSRFLERSSSPIKRAIKKTMFVLRRPLTPLVRLAMKTKAMERGQREKRARNNRTDIRCPTGYQIMERAGLKVGLINSLYTYPTWEVNGYLVSDWTMPPDASVFCYPPKVREYLDSIGYKSALDELKQVWGWLEGNMSDDPELVYERALKHHEKVKQATIHLMSTYEWDFHTTMFYLLDTVQHIFIDDEARLLEAYRIIDSTLAEIAEHLDLAEEKVCWLINSDHSMFHQWPDRTVKGMHDLTGFYCFAGTDLIRGDLRYTLKIEDLMPIVLHLYGLEFPETPWQECIRGQRILVREPEEKTVEDRLRALGYLS